MHRALEGGHVQRVSAARVAGRDVALLTVRVPGHTRHVVAVAGRGAAVVEGGDRLERLRSALRGGAPRDKARWTEIVDAAGDAELDAAALLDLLDRDLRDRWDALGRAVARAVSRVERRADAIRGDLARAAGADDLARRAQLFVAAAGAARGARELVATDYTVDPPVEVRLPIDPARGARAQIDAMFTRARRLKEGARIGRARLAETEAALHGLSRVAAAVTAGDGAAAGSGEGASAGVDLAALEALARSAAPRDFKAPSPVGAPRRRRDAEPSPPFRTFLGAFGKRILVGKGADRNDALTFHVARPIDLWLHAKGHAGAHVVVPLTRGASCPAELLVDAAHLAAHFSDARDEDRVEVQYVERRHLRKPKGSAPGFVVVAREKVLALRREPAILRRLLEAEVVT